MADELSGGNTDSGSAGTPSTFEQAFAADAAAASPAADPSAETPTPAGAETPSSTPEAQPQQEKPAREPFISRDRFDEVNTKKNELEQKLQALSWAESVDQQALADALQWYGRYTGDPVAFTTELINELAAHPTHGQALRSLAARTLAGGRNGQTDAMPEADVAITDAQGTVVGKTYSAEQLAKRDEWMQRQWLAQVEQKFAPVTTTIEQIQAERALAERQQQAEQFARTFHGDIAKLPGFEQHKTAIREKVAAAKLGSDDPGEVKAAFYQAYLDVVLPTLGSQAQAQLLDNLQQKAAASTGVNPGSVGAAASKTITSFDDPNLVW